MTSLDYLAAILAVKSSDVVQRATETLDHVSCVHAQVVTVAGWVEICARCGFTVRERRFVDDEPYTGIVRKEAASVPHRRGRVKRAPLPPTFPAFITEDVQRRAVTIFFQTDIYALPKHPALAFGCLALTTGVTGSELAQTALHLRLSVRKLRWSVKILTDEQTVRPWDPVRRSDAELSDWARCYAEGCVLNGAGLRRALLTLNDVEWGRASTCLCAAVCCADWQQPFRHIWRRAVQTVCGAPEKILKSEYGDVFIALAAPLFGVILARLWRKQRLTTAALTPADTIDKVVRLVLNADEVRVITRRDQDVLSVADWAAIISAVYRSTSDETFVFKTTLITSTAQGVYFRHDRHELRRLVYQRYFALNDD